MNNLKRPRRLRGSAAMRDLAAETMIDPRKLIMPYFIMETGSREAISSMPGIDRTGIDECLRDIADDVHAGVKQVLLFGIPALKDEAGSGAYADDGIVQQAVRRIKKEFPGLFVITDVCLCEYTSHGHCGHISGGKIINDPSVDLVVKTALSHAAAGADMVAPSDMMDGRVGAMRTALDGAGHDDLPIMAYAAKYASAFYGPFRDAAGSAPQFGDRKSYQMDPRNAREALREVRLDIEEGADIVMVKPALSYLDIIRGVSGMSEVPVCAYNVSGEYSMVKSAAQAGWIDEERIVREIITSIFRAGADMIISYHTRDMLNRKWHD